MITHNSKVEPVALGKVAIALQLILLAYVLLSINMESLPPAPGAFLFTTATVTCISGLHYIYKGFKLSHAF
jgi:phosphatidylglycerophosphate synthase